MTTLNLSLSSPTTSSGYGSEEDHSPMFHFPALTGGPAADRCPASPSSDRVTSRVSGSKFNELEVEEEDDDEDDDINIDVFGEICEYLELDDDDLLSNDCVEIPSTSGAELFSNCAKAGYRETAQDVHGKNLIWPGPREARGVSEKNTNTRNQIIPLTTKTGDKYNLADFSGTSQNSNSNQCSNQTALELSTSPTSREERSDDFVLETSVQCAKEANSRGITPGLPDHHISSTTAIQDEENPTKPRHQFRQNSSRLAKGNQRRKPVNQNEAAPSPSPPDKRRRTHHELDDHRYFCPAPKNADRLPVPVKVQKTSLDSTGSGFTGSGSSRRSEMSILETFLLTKETLNANKGSDGMLAEDSIARLYTGHRAPSRPASSFSSSSSSVLERILIGTSRNIPDAFASEHCSSTPIDSPDGDTETASAAPPGELDSNYEVFNDNNGKYDSNSILLEFFCEKLDDEVWTPSGDNGKVFSNEMDAIINSQTPNNQNDVWIHQYISDLL